LRELFANRGVILSCANNAIVFIHGEALVSKVLVTGLPSSIAREASFPNCLSRLDGKGSDGRLMTPSRAVLNDLSRSTSLIRRSRARSSRRGASGPRLRQWPACSRCARTSPHRVYAAGLHRTVVALAPSGGGRKPDARPRMRLHSALMFGDPCRSVGFGSELAYGGRIGLRDLHFDTE